jgi:hydroxyethylthiazole kinase-like uncharacterized protein yjeF
MFIMKICTVDQMRRMDRSAIEDWGLPEMLLMENAGMAAYRVLAERWPVAGSRVLICCGAGNNGGDGLVVARKVLADGGRPSVLLMGDPTRYRGAARTNFEIWQKLGGVCVEPDDAADFHDLLQQADLVVDGLLGTGLSKPVVGRYAALIAQINAAGRPVLSLDIPSGVDGNNGRIMGTAVKADATVTFGLPKTGNLLYPGFQQGGRLYVSHIAFPPALTESSALALALNAPPPLPPRDPAGHKGAFGDVLFIAGAAGYYGAPYFAAMALLKAGGGYARLAAPAPVVPVVAALGPEIVFHPQAATPAGSLAETNFEELGARAAQADMVVMGPGLSLDPETARLVRRLIPTIPVPLLLDGDALTMLGTEADIVRQRQAPTVLTPHPGEMARLTGWRTTAIQDDPVGAVQHAAAHFKAVVMLKGAHSLIGFPDGRVLINLSGNDGMATAGSGDVLTGTIAAMCGLGLSFEDAVAKGVLLHGWAGDIAAADCGADGMHARDILNALPEAVRRERAGRLPDLAPPIV